MCSQIQGIHSPVVLVPEDPRTAPAGTPWRRVGMQYGWVGGKGGGVSGEAHGHADEREGEFRCDPDSMNFRPTTRIAAGAGGISWADTRTRGHAGLIYIYMCVCMCLLSKGNNSAPQPGQVLGVEAPPPQPARPPTNVDSGDLRARMTPGKAACTCTLEP